MFASWLGLDLGEWWTWLIGVIFCAMKRWFCWAIDLLAGWIETALNAALAFLPEPPDIDLAPINQGWQVVDLWCPGTLLVSLAGAYGVWWVVFLTFRTVKKFIPTLA